MQKQFANFSHSFFILGIFMVEPEKQIKKSEFESETSQRVRF